METLTALKNRIALSGTSLKIFAMLCMTVDHMGLLLLDNFWLCRVIGRLAFPIFAYMIAEGCRYTRHRARYLLLLLGEGLLCSAVYYLAQGSLEQNILITFSLSVLLIFGLFDLKKQFSAPWEPAAEPLLEPLSGRFLVHVDGKEYDIYLEEQHYDA